MTAADVCTCQAGHYRAQLSRCAGDEHSEKWEMRKKRKNKTKIVVLHAIALQVVILSVMQL